jgi:metal-responsive CopG/Arc/MetJ family transcriptional regulator
MRKMIFSFPERLAERVDEVIKKDGFVNRPDFFRYLAMRYLDQRGEYFLKQMMKA